MARTKRVQVLMEPEEHRRLERVAKERRVSVAELIRRAVRMQYLSASASAAYPEAATEVVFAADRGVDWLPDALFEGPAGKLLRQRLEERAAKNRHSLAEEIELCLRRELLRRPQNPEAFLARADRLRKRIGGWATEEQINKWKREGRK